MGRAEPIQELGDAQVAMDLAAETFAKAFEKRSSFRGRTEEEAYGWLWTIARNELHQYWRTKRVSTDAVRSLGLARVQLQDEEIERVDELLSPALDADDLRSAVDALSDEHQTVLRLKVEQDMDYVEIAEHLGVSNDVVRARDSLEALEVLFASDTQRARHPERPPRLVLLALEPIDLALEVLRHRLKDPLARAIPVVVLAPRAGHPTIPEAQRLGANAVAIEPLGFDALARAVHPLGMSWLLLGGVR